MKIDFPALAQTLLSRAPEILFEWFPGGRTEGQEFMLGNIAGEPGDSLKINFKTGLWSDFATGQKGGDLISLYAAKQGIKNGEAARELNGGEPVKIKIRPVHAITKPPQNISLPTCKDHRYGIPSFIFQHRDASGELLWLNARYETEQGKTFRPWVWSGNKWISRGYPSPIPLYRIENLKNTPVETHVLLTEGERKCDAAQKIVGDRYVCLSWGSTGSVSTIDLAPLRDRKVLIWPDADTEGVKAAQRLANALLQISAEVKVIDTGDRPTKWDAANAAEEGWGWDEFYSWAKPRASVFTVTNILNVSEEVLDEPMGEDHLRLWESIGVYPNRQGTITASADNVLRALEALPEFKDFCWYDEFHLKFLTTWKSGNCQTTPIREWNDHDDLELMLFCQRKLGLSRLNDRTANQAVRLFAVRRKRNEPKDWMDKLKWDGVARTEHFFTKYMGVKESLYAFCASDNFWIGLVARIFQPGCKVDNMVVLYGPQGVFKSTSVAIIGGLWFAEVHEAVTKKDFYVDLQGKLVVEISELGSFKSTDLSAIKAAVARSSDRYRDPYGRSSQDHPRQCIFVGTTNDYQFLRDETGGRRFWPMAVGKIDKDAIATDRDQLFAEAVSKYKAGNKWYMMPESTSDVQENHRQADDWEMPISEFCTLKKEVKSLEIAQECLRLDVRDIDALVTRRICKILAKLGFENKVVKKLSKTERVWIKQNSAVTCNQNT